MGHSVIVLGAGMVGTCTALQLQQRGVDVALIDRRAPGLETSFGNAGLIQREAVEPYAFPRDPGFLFNVALHRPWRWPGLGFVLSFVALFAARILFGP